MTNGRRFIVTSAVRYERDQPGELPHMDCRKLGRVPDSSAHSLGQAPRRIRRAPSLYSRERAVHAGPSVRWLLFGFPEDLTYRPVLGLRLDELV